MEEISFERVFEILELNKLKLFNDIKEKTQDFERKRLSWGLSVDQITRQKMKIVAFSNLLEKTSEEIKRLI
jgi:hypothetical protein